MIKLTYENDSPVFVDPKFVSHVLAHQTGMTAVQIVNYGAIMVKEDAAVVAAMIDAAKPLSGFWSWFSKKS